MSDNYTLAKVCSKCKREFPATTEFFAWHKRSGKLYSQCRECHRAAKREERKRNDARYRASSQQWHIDHREEQKQKRRIHYIQNKNEYIERSQSYQKENAERVNLSHRLWSATPQGQRHEKAKRARRRAMIKNAEGSHTREDIRILYDEQEGRCAYCGITLHNEYHLDHIIPLIQGGSNNPDNLACACAACNLSKNEKLLEEWMVSRGW